MQSNLPLVCVHQARPRSNISLLISKRLHNPASLLRINWRWLTFNPNQAQEFDIFSVSMAGHVDVQILLGTYTKFLET